VHVVDSLGVRVRVPHVRVSPALSLMANVSPVAPAPASVLTTVAVNVIGVFTSTFVEAVSWTPIPAWITWVVAVEVAVAFTLNWSVAVTVTVSVTSPVVVGV
jgi:hypothetical protein